MWCVFFQLPIWCCSSSSLIAPISLWFAASYTRAQIHTKCMNWRMSTHLCTLNTNLYTHASHNVILLPRERARKMTIYLLWALGLWQLRLPVPEKKKKEKKSDSETQGEGSQKVGEHQRWTERGERGQENKKQERNEAQSAAGWKSKWEFAGEC